VKTKLDTGIVLWMLAGAAILALFLIVGWHFYRVENPAQELAFKASRADTVGRMQLALASASEAEKSAVLATTDQDSRMLADRARAATAEVEQEREELANLLATGGTQREKDLLAQFSGAFDNLRRVDDEVLRLAVKNTNLKAYKLLFGPAAETLAEIDAALSRVVAKCAGSRDCSQLMPLAFGAQIGVLRIQTLLAPHIAEESDAEMDRMEALMAKEVTQVRADLDGLASKLPRDPDVAMAGVRFVRYGELKAQILSLSRENTNVRSLALSLNQKRKALLLCLEASDALKQAILEEPIAGVTYGRPPKPR